LNIDDGLAVEVLAEAALSTAALTVAPSGSEIEPMALSVIPFRPASLESATLIAQARVVRRTQTFTQTEATVSDDRGQEIARVFVAVAIRPLDPPPPPAGPLGAPFEGPAYTTADPYLRPLPPGVGPVPRELWERHDGLALVRLAVAGEVCLPIYRLLGFRPLDADRGRVTFGLIASDWICHRRGRVAAGVLAVVTRDLLSTTSLTVAPVGVRLGVTNVGVTFHRPVVPDGQDLVAVGCVTDHEGDSVVASAAIADSSGRPVLTAYQSSVLLPLRPRPAPRAEVTLTTVLFTDLVGSTARAAELGDGPWRTLLHEHAHDVRRQLQAFSGREIKSLGDGFLATFDSPARATRCARAILDATRRLGIDARAGIHTGECELTASDVTGIAVHLASRVLDNAGPGEVLVSGTVRDLLLGSELRFADRGRHKLKGIEGEWPLFALET
jgi:class 3 adenylate cyclase